MNIERLEDRRLMSVAATDPIVMPPAPPALPPIVALLHRPRSTYVPPPRCSFLPPPGGEPMP